LKGLIVTADDFGAAVEVNEAVELAHREGVVTAASLMVMAPAAADAVSRAKRMPALRVGLHLVMTDGRPILPASAVPDLVDESGSFRADLVAFGCLLMCNRHARRQLAAEIAAQFEAFRATGLALDHCNAHKHFHLHPVIGSLMVAIGERFGLRSVRVPREPAAPLAPLAARWPSIEARLMAPFTTALRLKVVKSGMHVPDQVFGLRWSGQMTKTRLLHLIPRLPEGLSEIYLHPATGTFCGYAEGYQYEVELAALIDPDVIAACRKAPLTMGGYADFLSCVPKPYLDAEHNAA
jgi:hopanoid biosynthesis associated protein HpnK